VSRTKENVLVDKIGLDAVVFLRFTRMLRNIFLALGVIGIAIMIPVNVATRDKAISGTSAFAVMTPLYVFGGGLWAQVVVAWTIDLIVGFFLWHNYRRVHQLRRAYFESPEYQNSLHARTILIRDIPPSARTDEGIMQIADEVNPTGIVPRTTIGRNVKVLPDLIEEHEENVRELESVLAKYMKRPDRLPPNRPTMKAPSKYTGQTVNGKVDAIDYLTERIRDLELRIGEVRDSVDKRDAMSYGFASWDQISDAHAVAYAAQKKRPRGAKIRLAPKPNDLIWNNLALSRATRRRKRFMNGVWIVVLTLLWTPLNAGIAIFLSNLSNLGRVWPGFQRQLEAHHAGWAIVQGIASPALTSLVYLVLPIIFRRLQIRAGDITKIDRERHVLRNLYSFFTLNNLIVFSIFSAVWQYITSVIENDKQGNNAWDAIVKGQFFLTVTTALCQISPFWVTWILQRNLGAAIDLAQLWNLTYVWFARTFLAPTPRQNIEWTAPPAFDYASYYNYFLFYATVALCFSTLQPIVLVVTALYFSVDAFLKKYLLMYVFITKTESGAQFWQTLFNRLVFAVMLSNVVIAVVVKARGSWAMVAALVPLLFIMLALKWHCTRTFDLEMKYYVRTGMHDQERLAPETKHHHIGRISHKFGHPALYKPLMTPMVHAKARHILAQVYRGRLNDNAGQPIVFSDIAMQPMTQDGKPQQDAPFELVPEAQQDFAYYKNRSDFQDEAGELYGRPDDLINERSQTPVPLMQKDGFDSQRTSRDFTPPKSVPRAIPRKEFDQSHVPQAFRWGELTRESSATHEQEEAGDLGLQHSAYTDPYDDRANLLGGMGDIRTSNGEFMSIDRWRTGDSAQDTPGDEEHSSYDYFRGRR